MVVLEEVFGLAKLAPLKPRSAEDASYRATAALGYVASIDTSL